MENIKYTEESEKSIMNHPLQRWSINSLPFLFHPSLVHLFCLSFLNLYSIYLFIQLKYDVKYYVRFS